jgi:raffinose/stachyose/melibiose transport system permease protein
MKKRTSLGLYIFLLLVAVVQLLPLLVTVLNSLRFDKDIKKFPVGIPLHPQFNNYLRAWNVGGYSTAFINSMAISMIASLVILILAMISGYFLARLSTRLKNYLILYYGVALSIPVFSFMVPLYFRFSEWGLVNTHTGIIIIYVALNLPFNILLARTFISDIPISLDEAATIDGCSSYQILWQIIFPLSKPVVTTILLIVFVATWNEFTLANTFLQIPEMKTAATRYVLFVGERGADLSMVYAAGVITMLPIIVAFIALQNYFIEGMTSGSIK